MKSSIKESIRDLFSKYLELGAVVSVLCMVTVFTYLNPRFLTLPTLASIITLATELGIVAIGEAFLIISGEFDLSVGSVFAFASTVFTWLVNSGAHIGIALLGSFALATCIGLTNAVITLKGRIPSFITTLGMMWFLRGLLLATTRGFPVRIEVKVPELNWFSQPILYEFRISSIWFLILIIVMHIVLTSTPYGNKVQAVGGALETARALGVNTSKIKTINFVLSSNFAALSGIIAVSRFMVVEPVAGTGLELEAIAASVIGGTVLSGGVGSIIGAALGALLVGLIRVGLILAGAPAYWYIGFLGVILIIVGIINLRWVRRV
jgi:simple sugar transport system permease protein